AFEKDHDDGLVLAFRGRWFLGPRPQQVGQGQAADAEGANPEEITAGNAVAQAGLSGAEESEHDRTPWMVRAQAERWDEVVLRRFAEALEGVPTRSVGTSFRS